MSNIVNRRFIDNIVVPTESTIFNFNFNIYYPEYDITQSYVGIQFEWITYEGQTYCNVYYLSEEGNMTAFQSFDGVINWFDYDGITAREGLISTDSNDETIVTWILANTKEITTPIATITYNGQVIASLNAGETATLSCKDMKMVSDVVVKANEVESKIPEGYVKPEGDVTLTTNGSHDVAGKKTAIVDVPTIIDVTELPTNPKDTDTRSIYRCNGKLYVVDEFGAGTTWRIDNTRTGTMGIDGMAYWDIPFESNGETFSNFGIYRGDSTNSFCHIDYNGSRVYTATAKSQGTWTNENYRTVRLLKNVSSGYHSLGSWLSANGERVTNVWVEYIKPEGTLELVFNNIEAEFPIDCSQYAKVTVNTAEPLKITDPTVLDNITDSPYGVGGNVFLYEGATTDSYEKGALYYLEDTDK